MQIIGITGGIGSGKTTVCKLFERMGVPVYYADDRAKWLLNNQKDVIQQVKNLLGEESYLNNEINKTYIANKVFHNKDLLQQYNEIVHPVVAFDTLEWMQQYLYKKYILKEAALLIETGIYKTLDKLIVVTAPIDLRIERVIKRDRLSKKEVEARINNQMPQEEKIKYADFVVINDGKHNLEEQVNKIHTALEYQY